MKSLDETKQDLKDKISKNKFNAIFEELNNILLEKGKLHNQFILIKNRFDELFSKIIMGTSPEDKIEVYRTKLVNSLIQFIDGIEKSDIKIYRKKRGEIIDSPIDRTIQIIEELNKLSKLEPNNNGKADIWCFSFLSIFAVNKNDPNLNASQPTYIKKLLTEKRALISLLEKGFTMKCIICPASQYSLRSREDDINRAIIRTGNLIDFLESDEKFLKNIDWAISRYDYENRYIIGDNAMFLGLRYGLEVGYGVTYFTKYKDYIEMKREFYESQFKDRSDLTLVRYGNQKTPNFRSSKLKREAVITCLKESLTYLKELLIK